MMENIKIVQEYVKIAKQAPGVNLVIQQTQTLVLLVKMD